MDEVEGEGEGEGEGESIVTSTHRILRIHLSVTTIYYNC